MDIHLEAEDKVAAFKGVESSLIYSAGYTANVGLIPSLVQGKQDIIISDELNHGSIIDGVRLTKAQRAVFPHNDMGAFEQVLKENQDAERKLVIVDGVFSMDGDICPLDELTALAEEYNAMVMVDDCHATGFIGKNGKGSGEHCGVLDKVDIISSTFGKALGGASGGFISASKNIVDTLRQKSRPYLFSNSLAPALVVACLKAIDIILSLIHI